MGSKMFHAKTPRTQRKDQRIKGSKEQRNNLFNPLNPLNRQFRQFITFSFFLFTFSLLSGCVKYSFTGAVPTHLKTVAVPLMKNQTAEYGVVERLTDGVIGRIQRDNSLKIADASVSDAVLRGTLERVEDAPYTYSGQADPSTFNVNEYRLTLTVKIEYFDQTKNEVIWTQEFRNFGTYQHTSGTPEERDVGMDQAITKISDDIVNQMVSGW